MKTKVIELYVDVIKDLNDRAAFIIQNTSGELPYYLPDGYKVIIDKKFIFLYPKESPEFSTNSYCYLKHKDFINGSKWQITETSHACFEIKKIGFCDELINLLRIMKIRAQG